MRYTGNGRMRALGGYWELAGSILLAQWFLSLAYGSAPAARKLRQSVTSQSYWPRCFGWLLWDEVPDHYAILGALLIFTSALLVLSSEPKQAVIPDGRKENRVTIDLGKQTSAVEQP